MPLRECNIEGVQFLKGLDRLDAGKMVPLAEEARTREHSSNLKGRSI